MPAPVVHPFPVKRPGFIESAVWLGGDEDLALEIAFRNLGGGLDVVSLQATGENPGEICLPASTDPANLGPRARDILVAHLRMACMIRGIAIPCSREFEDVWVVQSESNYFQTALGTTKVVGCIPLTDSTARISWRIGNGPVYATDVGHGEINSYAFAPLTQLLVVPGAVKKAFPSYVHNYPSGPVLTTAQKDEIATYVLGLSPWC